MTLSGLSPRHFGPNLNSMAFSETGGDTFDGRIARTGRREARLRKKRLTTVRYRSHLRADPFGMYDGAVPSFGGVRPPMRCEVFRSAFLRRVLKAKSAFQGALRSGSEPLPPPGKSAEFHATCVIDCGNTGKSVFGDSPRKAVSGAEGE